MVITQVTGHSISTLGDCNKVEEIVRKVIRLCLYYVNECWYSVRVGGCMDGCLSVMYMCVCICVHVCVHVRA